MNVKFSNGFIILLVQNVKNINIFPTSINNILGVEKQNMNFEYSISKYILKFNMNFMKRIVKIVLNFT